MTKTNAFWEKDNLGVDCVEFLITAHDRTCDYSGAVINEKAEYQVAKVESGNTEALLFLQENGFKMIEMNLQLELKMESEPLPPSIYSRMSKDLIIREATEDESNMILYVIENGTVFATDKISCDPFFGPKMAGRRYALWSRNILERGNKFNVVLYKDNVVAFSLGIVKDGFFDAFLGGLIDKKYCSFGFAPILSNLLTAYSKNINVVRTGVSSNNLPIIKLHELYGFHTKDIFYCLIKHIPDMK